MTLLTTVSPKSYNVYIKAYLVDYPNVVTYTLKNIEITAPACDCSALAWDAPVVATPTFAVAATGTPTLTLPVANTSAKSTNAPYAACYNIAPASGCAETGRFSAGSIKYDDGVTSGGTTLPSWITFSSTGTSAQTISIAPPDGTKNGKHKLFATFTPDHGSPITYTVMHFEVTCTLTDYVMPSIPTEPTFDLSYIIHAEPMTIDLSTLAYTETPTCGYSVTT